jgi:hypothetical protein
MAKIVEEKITIVLSQLSKNDGKGTESAISTELLEALEAVSQELVAAGVVVEIVKE